MVHRRIGFCKNCDSNVVQVRAFRNRYAWLFDRITFGLMAALGLGPWKCVDCGQTHFVSRKNPNARRDTTVADASGDEAAPVSNFLKSERSLVNAANNQERFSFKFREEVVSRLQSGQSDPVAVCKELGITRAELEGWIAMFDAEAGEENGSVELEAELPVRDSNSIVIESTAVKKT